MNRWAAIDSSNTVIDIKQGNEFDQAWNTESSLTIKPTWILLGADDTAAVGDVYPLSTSAPLSPKPYESWVLHNTGFYWVPPVEYPGTDAGQYTWDEPTLQWIEVPSV